MKMLRFFIFCLTAGVTSAATFAINNAAFFWMPGMGDIIGSTSVTVPTGGVVMRHDLTVSGITSYSVGVDVSLLVGAGVDPARYPYIGVTIDGVTSTPVQLTPSSTTVTLATGISVGLHRDVELAYIYADSSNLVNRWVSYFWVITSITCDAVSASTARSVSLVFFGDSITENAADSTYPALQSYANVVGSLMNATVSKIGFSGQGFTNSYVPVPGLYSTGTWDLIYLGKPRNVTPDPTIIYIAEGQNFGDSVQPADIVAFMEEVRAEYPTSYLEVIVPIGPQATVGATQVYNGFTNYVTAHGSDTRVNRQYYADLGQQITRQYSTDLIHPNVIGSALFGYLVYLNSIGFSFPSRLASKPGGGVVVATAGGF